MRHLTDKKKTKMQEKEFKTLLTLFILHLYLKLDVIECPLLIICCPSSLNSRRLTNDKIQTSSSFYFVFV